MITSALCALVVVPLWIAAPNTVLIALGGFLMQFFVQGAWGVIPAHINELSPGDLRGFFPGLAYQLGVALSREHPVRRIAARRVSSPTDSPWAFSPRSS